MSVPIPFPAPYVLLLLALPGVWLLARALAHAITTDRGLRAVLPLGLGICLWLSAVHAASMAAGSLAVGLPSATLALAAIGVLAERARRRADGVRPATGLRPSRAMWISMAAAAALMAPAALRYWFHDELPFVGHMSIAAEMQNGIYPPRNLGLPDVPLRYHYGFDLLTACLTALLRLQVDRAIDAGTLALFCVSWCLFWVLGERLAGRAGAWLPPLLALFAGGLPLACDPPGASFVERVTMSCAAGGATINAPVTSFVFQHPWSLGLPVAATVALLLTERRPESPAARLFALWLALALLSLSEIALFASVLPAVVVAETGYEGALELGRGAALLGVAALALGAARLAGGSFARVPSLVPLRFQLHPGFANGATASLAWNAETFGVLFPLGLAGFVALRRGRVFWALLAGGSIALVNAVRFVGTADIIKFATVASIALGVLGSVALARLWDARSTARRAAALALAFLATAHGLAFPLVLALDRPAVPEPMRRAPEALPPEEIEAMTFVRRHARAGELVYHDKRGIVGWAQWGGVPQPFRTWMDTSFGLPGDRLYARERLLARMPADAEAYVAQGFAWFVLGDDDASLGRIADAWIRAGRAREGARFGRLRVVELPRGAGP